MSDKDDMVNKDSADIVRRSLLNLKGCPQCDADIPVENLYCTPCWKIAVESLNAANIVTVATGPRPRNEAK